MALSDSLVAYYSLEERFDEAFSAENSVAPNAMPLLSLNDPSAGTGSIYVRSIAGKIGLAAAGTEAASTVKLEAASEHAIAILDNDKTFAFWVKLTSTKQEDSLLGKGEALIEYAFAHDGTDWVLFNDTQSVSFSHVPELDAWHLIIFWFDLANSVAYVKVDDGIPVSGAFTPTLQAGTSFRCATGAVAIDELGIWDRILTADEMQALHNLGDGMSYAEIVADGQDGACREAECCPDPIGSYVATPGNGMGYDSLCEPLPKAIFEPPSGSRLILPSLVVIRSDNPDAVIHYTTDGSVPDTNSPIYTGAITVESPLTVVRAVAIVDGCPPGPASVAQYSDWSPAAHFTYACTTTDQAGQWDGFAANGSDDYNWEFQLQVTDTVNIKEFTILQLFPDGTFTGSCWSTKEFIYPWGSDPDKEQRAFPLVIIINTVQQNADYHDDYSTGVGNFVAGSYIIEMYGQPWTDLPSDHIFKLLVTFTDGSSLSRLVDTTCDALPATLCPIPEIDSLVSGCSPYRIDITFSLTVGTSFSIGRQLSDGTEGLTLTSGAVATSPQTFQDTTVVPGVEYQYSLAHVPTGCAVTKYSPLVSIVAPPPASVSISAAPSTIGVGQSSTISWDSLNNVGTVDISPTIGAQAGNIPDSQSVSPVVTTVYTITGQDACGTQSTAQATVTVEPAPSCGSVEPVIAISGYSDALFDLSACSGDMQPTGDPAWNGQLRSFPIDPCLYQVNAGQSIGGKSLDTQSALEIVGGLWRLTILIDGIIADNYLMWRGTKSFGTTAAGVYTRTAGCAATPTSLTIVEVT